MFFQFENFKSNEIFFVFNKNVFSTVVRRRAALVRPEVSGLAEGHGRGPQGRFRDRVVGAAGRTLPSPARSQLRKVTPQRTK